MRFDLDEPIRPWVVSREGMEFVMPQGVQQFPVHIEVNVPQDAALGSYGGSATFITNPDCSSGVCVGLGAQATIAVVVDTAIYRDFQGPRLAYMGSPLRVGDNPTVYVRVANEGNVPDGPDSARLVQLGAGAEFPKVQAFTCGNVDIPTSFPRPVEGSPGMRHWNLEVYAAGQVVFTWDLFFEVLPPAVGVEPREARVSSFLGPAAPNPFVESTKLRFRVSAPSPVSLRVYDMAGRVVRTLLKSTPLEAGEYSVQWDGRGDDRLRKAPGVYFYRLELGGRQETRRAILLK